MLVWIESNFLARLVPWDIDNYKKDRKILLKLNVYNLNLAR